VETIVMKFRRIQGLAAGLALTLSLAGCSGDPDKIGAVPASGTVTYKGKPLETGSIQFIPAKGRSASGVIKEGNFVMSTYDELDGAIPGKHAVIISAYKEVKVAGSTEPEQDLIVPEKYANAASSGLTVEIPSGGKKDIELKLD
jgi:hypothetical protein